MKSKYTIKFCIYCGTKNPETKDHVPPKGIFAPPRPNDLITVPCCKKCHKGTSIDDEYFRNMLAMNKEIFNHPDVQGVLPKIHRALAKPEKRNFTKNLLKSIKEVEIVTDSGILLGKGATYDVDKFRLDKVVERTVKGLYWYERKVVFPYDGIMKSYLLDNMRFINKKTIDELGKILSSGTEKTIGRNTVRYRMAKGTDEHLELWLMTFYERVKFLVFLIPNMKTINKV